MTTSIFPLSKVKCSDSFNFGPGILDIFKDNKQVQRVILSVLEEKDKEFINQASEALCENRLFTVHNQEETPEAAKRLTAWVCEKIGNPEYQTRIVAAEKILAAYKNHSEELDLSWLNLTDLPQDLKELSGLKTLLINGNLLGKESLDLIEKLPDILNRQALAKEIAHQAHVVSKPGCFYKLTTPHDLSETHKDWHDHRMQVMVTKLADLMTKTKVSTRIEESKITIKTHVLSPLFKENILPNIARELVIQACVISCIAAIQFFPLASVIAFSALALLYISYVLFKKFVFDPNMADRLINNLCTIHAVGEKTGNTQFMINSLAHLLCKDLAKQIPEDHLKSIQEAISDTLTGDCFTAKAFEKFQKGELVILPLGYISLSGPSHLAYHVLYKNHLIICDRAKGSHYPLNLFEIDPSKVTLQFFENLKSFYNTPQSAHGDSYFSYYGFNALGLALDAKPLYLPRALETKYQKVGNCSFANLKAALKASAYLLQGYQKDEKKDEDNGKVAQTRKRAFSYLMRKDALEGCKLPFMRFYIWITGQSHLVEEAERKLGSYKKRKIDLAS